MLYKYRQVKEFRYFTDIILNNRLYAAPYFDLNDPMEGRYLFRGTDDRFDENLKRLIKGEKEKIRICSLSQDPNNVLMWTHYAEGHKGVVIGVEINRKKYIVKKVKYDGLCQFDEIMQHRNAAIEILSHKLNAWEYEKEERVFIKNEKYVDIVIKKVIMGSSMSNQDVGFIRELINKINPNIIVINARTHEGYR